MSQKIVYDLHAEVCKALAHPLRIEIIDILQTKEFCFSELLEQVGGLKSNLSQHLSIMVSAGILRVRKDSRCNYYKVTSPKVVKACALIRQILIENINNQQKLHATVLNQ